MPLISIESNQVLSDKTQLSTISQAIASMLSKPESYVMVKYTHNSMMLFAGNDTPLAYVKLKSLGLPEEQTANYSNKITTLLAEIFNISAERIYIEFTTPARHMWGWNGATF